MYNQSDKKKMNIVFSGIKGKTIFLTLKVEILFFCGITLLQKGYHFLVTEFHVEDTIID